MKKTLFLFTLISHFFAISSFSQSKEVLELENIKNSLTKKIASLNDSVSKIEKKIELLKTSEILSTISDSTLRGMTIKGAKLKKSPDPLGEISTTFDQEKEVIILDYSDLYFGVCSGGICGYMSEIWIKKSQDVENFISAKNFEKEELKKLEIETIITCHSNFPVLNHFLHPWPKG